MNKKKTVIITVMLVVLSIMAIGYSFFATRLNINATGSIDSAWNVYFSKIEVGTKSSGASTKSTPSVSNTTANMEASLKSPGDYINFNITLVNGGSVDAIIEDIEATAEGTPAIIFSISGIKIGDKLAGGSNTSKVITIKMEYDSSTTSQPSNLTKRLTVNIDAVQDIGQSIIQTDPSITQPLLLSNAILRNNTAYATNTSSPYVTSSTGIDFSKPSSDTNGKGLYMANDDDGVSYYFRGDVDNNYVKFGDDITYEIEEEEEHCTYLYRVNVVIGYDEEGFEDRYIGDDWYGTLEACQASSEYNEYKSYDIDACEELEDSCGTITETVTKNTPLLWRIVRINGDGSIRLVIDINDDTEKILLEYEGWTAVDYAKIVDGTKVNSSIKSNVDSWYTEYLESGYGKYLVDTTFCNDREVDDSDLGIFKSSVRLDENKPVLTCNRPEDRFTVDATKGNGLLDKPIGLLTTDEIVLAGGIYGGFEDVGENNSTSYLKYSNLEGYGYYGTMTPMDESLNVFLGSGNGNIMGVCEFDLCHGYTSDETNIRPVINLRSDILVTGTGTINDPYVVQTN